MAESAALATVPFYPPVRTGAGLLFKFGATPKGPTRLKLEARAAGPEPDDGLAYDRSGRHVGDPRIGRLLNIYV